MAGQNAVSHRDMGTVTDADETTVGRPVFPFTCDPVLQSVHDDIRPPDRNAPGIVAVFRILPVRNGCKSATGNCQLRLIDRKHDDICDLIKIPEDGCICIHHSIFIHDKHIRLRRAVILIGAKTNITSHIGVRYGHEAGAR